MANQNSESEEILHQQDLEEREAQREVNGELPEERDEVEAVNQAYEDWTNETFDPESDSTLSQESLEKLWSASEEELQALLGAAVRANRERNNVPNNDEH